MRGLRNLGNSCFMNSALQCLTHIKPLAKLLLTEGAAGEKDGNLIASMFREHLAAYYGKGTDALSSNSLFRNLKKVNSRMTPGRQHDAHEFALGILGPLEDHFKKVKKLDLFEKVFGGKLVSQITCLSCKHISNSYESMISLSLVLPFYKDINKARSLDEALKEFFKPEYLKNENRYRCEKCRTKVDAKKQYRIDQRPNCLVLQLKRFDFRARKISSNVSFPEFLSLDDYSTNPVQGQKYELTGIVVHLGGSLYSGHYVSYVKSAGKWHSVKSSH